MGTWPCGYEWHSSTCCYATKDLKILKWTVEIGCPYDEETCLWAALYGNLESLKWLRSIGCPWNSTAYHYCTNLSVAKYLKENGCQMDEKFSTTNADANSLEILKWARANGCPWNEETFSAAAGSGSMKVVKWLGGNGCPTDKRLS
jgi:hypothetical protein